MLFYRIQTVAVMYWYIEVVHVRSKVPYVVGPKSLAFDFAALSSIVFREEGKMQ